VSQDEQLAVPCVFARLLLQRRAVGAHWEMERWGTPSITKCSDSSSACSRINYSTPVSFHIGGAGEEGARTASRFVLHLVQTPRVAGRAGKGMPPAQHGRDTAKTRDNRE